MYAICCMFSIYCLFEACLTVTVSGLCVIWTWPSWGVSIFPRLDYEKLKDSSAIWFPRELLCLLWKTGLLLSIRVFPFLNCLLLIPSIFNSFSPLIRLVNVLRWFSVISKSGYDPWDFRYHAPLGKKASVTKFCTLWFRLSSAFSAFICNKYLVCTPIRPWFFEVNVIELRYVSYFDDFCNRPILPSPCCIGVMSIL